jgi:hypothetical protein
MSLYEGVAAVTSVGALIAVYVTVWMLRRQLKIMELQNKHVLTSLKLSTEGSLDQLYSVITQAYLDYPELRAIFHEDEGNSEQGALDERTLLRANALAEAITDGMEKTLELPHVGMSDLSASLSAWTADSLRYSSFLRAWLADHRDWYSDSLLDLLRRIERDRGATR